MTIEQLEALEAQHGPRQQSRGSYSPGNRKNQIRHITVLRAVDLLGRLPR